MGDDGRVTRPTARVLALLELLQAGPRLRRVGDLAERLDVDERTLRRYLAHLQDLGVPVESVRGRHGGVRLAPGYRMPPLMLTDGEAVAVMLGLVAARRAGLLPPAVSDDVAGGGAADGAAAKLRRVLPAALVHRVDALLADLQVTAPSGPVGAPAAEVLLTAATATAERRPVALTYTRADGDRSRRTVHPHGVVVHRGRWYLSATDTAVGELRTFRLDQVTDATALVGSFDAPPDLDPAAHVLESLARTPWRHEVVLRVRGTADEVTAMFPAGLALAEDLADPGGWARVTLRADSLDWVPALLAGLPVPFVVEGPEELRELVRATAERLADALGPRADVPGHSPQ